MILIGNGPVPFATAGPQSVSGGAGNGQFGAAGGTGAETIPAASRDRTGGEIVDVSSMASRSALRPVIPASVIDSAALAPQDIADNANGNSSKRQGAEAETIGDPESLLEYHHAPVAPLTAFASIPTQVSAEIQEMRADPVDPKQPLPEREEPQDLLASDISAPVPLQKSDDAVREPVEPITPPAVSAAYRFGDTGDMASAGSFLEEEMHQIDRTT